MNSIQYPPALLNYSITSSSDDLILALSFDSAFSDTNTRKSVDF